MYGPTWVSESKILYPFLAMCFLLVSLPDEIGGYARDIFELFEPKQALQRRSRPLGPEELFRHAEELVCYAADFFDLSEPKQALQRRSRPLGPEELFRHAEELLCDLNIGFRLRQIALRTARLARVALAAAHHDVYARGMFDRQSVVGAGELVIRHHFDLGEQRAQLRAVQVYVVELPRRNRAVPQRSRDDVRNDVN